jgi:hypothetical protein
MRLLIALGTAAFCAACAAVAPSSCETDLVGTWRARIEGLPDATLRLEKHPEFADTVKGHLERDRVRIELAGDIDGDDFTLEESANGRNISATWLGEVVQGSCGREVRGTWKAEGTPVERPFVLTKQP